METEQDTNIDNLQQLKSAWLDALTFPISYEEKSCIKDTLSFRQIFEQHRKIDKEEAANYYLTDEKLIDQLLEGWNSLPKKEKFIILVKLHKSLDSVLTKCRKKIEAVEEGKRRPGEHKTSGVHLKFSLTACALSFEDLISFSRRISAHVRAPPEYNDPTGVDGFCVPGYFFPCPDRVTMSRSTLFYADQIRAVPPTISFRSDSRTRAMYWVDIQTPTPKATIFFAINNTSAWGLYTPTQKPFITGPGQYTLRAYCQSEGYLSSEVTIADADVPGPETTMDVEALTRATLDMQKPTDLTSHVTAGEVLPHREPTILSELQSAPSAKPKSPIVEPPPTLPSTTAPTKVTPSPSTTMGMKFGGLFLGSAVDSEDEESAGSNESGDTSANE